MERIEILGFIAAILTTAAFVPQVYRIWKYKSVKDISFFMYLIFLIGVLLWMVYGWTIGSPSVVLANSVTAILVVAVLFLKRRYS